MLILYFHHDSNKIVEVMEHTDEGKDELQAVVSPTSKLQHKATQGICSPMGRDTISFVRTVCLDWSNSLVSSPFPRKYWVFKRTLVQQVNKDTEIFISEASLIFNNENA